VWLSMRDSHRALISLGLCQIVQCSFMSRYDICILVILYYNTLNKKDNYLASAFFGLIQSIGIVWYSHLNSIRKKLWQYIYFNMLILLT
jgi:hypothetical protein